MIFDLQIVHDLSHIGHTLGDFPGTVALELGVDFAAESDDGALNSVFHKVVHLVLNERSVQIFSMPESRSEFIALASLSPPMGITAI